MRNVRGGYAVADCALRAALTEVQGRRRAWERGTAVMEFKDETQQKPAIAVVDLTERREAIRNDAFFEIKTPQYPDCSHQWRGVTLDRGTRRVFCKCGEQIDPFDALLIYAHAEQRLQHTREVIEEQKRKEQEKKDKKPHFHRHTGYSTRFGTRGEPIGYDMRLECGHGVFWDVRWRRRKGAPRGVTCNECYREAQLKARGVAVVKPLEAATNV